MAHLYEVYKYRIKYVRLQWCRQVLKIIDSKLKKKYSINDFGCNYFQLYKEIKIKKKKNKIDYYGLDKDIKAVKIGLKYFRVKITRRTVFNIFIHKLGIEAYCGPYRRLPPEKDLGKCPSYNKQAR